MYADGRGVPQDNATAVALYRLAAEEGIAEAQWFLGTMYQFGDGVIQDRVYAHMWYNIAASAGNENAVELRNRVATRMTTEDISKALQLARECVAKNYKGC